MTNNPDNQSRSFTAFSSAREETSRRSEITDLTEELSEQPERGGAIAAPSEVTVLERRVLAHERILQALVAHLADDDAEILVQLKARFGPSHILGDYEQDYVSTEHYGSSFIRATEAELAQRKRR